MITVKKYLKIGFDAKSLVTQRPVMVCNIHTHKRGKNLLYSSGNVCSFHLNRLMRNWQCYFMYCTYH